MKKQSTIHVVTSGEYSDFDVVGVFSTREKAEEYAIFEGGCDVEERSFDPPPPPKYLAEILLSSGEVVSVPERDKLRLLKRNEFPLRRGDEAVVVVSSKSQEHANKLAVGYRQAWLSKKEPLKARVQQQLTVSSVTQALREGFTHGYVTSEIGDRQSVRFSVLTSVGEDEYLFFHDAQLDQILEFSSGVKDFTAPILDRWHRYMTLSKDELEKEDGVLHVPLLGTELAEATNG